MGNLKLLVTTICLSLALTACSDDKGSGSEARSHGGDPREFRGEVDLNQVNSNTSSITWGQIYEYNHGLNVASFQNRVDDFLSPQLDADQIGSVNDTFGDSNTGIFFYGRGLSFSRNPDTDSTGFVRETDVFNTNTAELRVEVEDLFQGARGVIPIHFNQNGNGYGALTASLVEDNFIQLVFEDEFGKISFEGNLFVTNDNEVLYLGDVNYRNIARLRAGGNLETVNEGTAFLGGFSVNACNFFDVDTLLGIRCN